MDLDSQIFFGKYKGLTIKEIYEGKKSISNDLLNKYLYFLLQKNLIFIGTETRDFVNLIKSQFDFEIRNNIIFTLPKENWVDLHLRDDLSEYLSRIFNNASFINLKLDSYIEENFSFTDFNSGSPDYLSWCIDTIEDFYIEDIHLLKSIRINTFTGVDINLKSKYVYEYEAKFRSKDYSFPQKTLELNNQKVEKYYDFDESSFHDEDNKFSNDYEEDTFDALTDGQLGDYDNFKENGGSIDDISDWSGN